MKNSNFEYANQKLRTFDYTLIKERDNPSFSIKQCSSNKET